ncbi:MAG: hypothetical protein JWL81_2346, partial [Verrucomicrobiales bacterium]|nr:hypothetical protein [Verrucomicrobiales bacterium]
VICYYLFNWWNRDFQRGAGGPGGEPFYLRVTRHWGLLTGFGVNPDRMSPSLPEDPATMGL